MKQKWNIAALPLLVLGCGGLAGGLWALMNRLCLDEKGLLVSGNILWILILLLAAAATVGILVISRGLDGSNRYVDNFSSSLSGGVTSFAAAVGILVLMLTNLGSQRSALSALWLVLGFLSVPALILSGICRLRGTRPQFLLHGIVCAFFGIHLACHYQVWSGEPQMTDYVWQLFACVGLTLTAYHHTAFDVGLGRRRLQLAFSLLSAFFCLACLAAEGYGLFYLTCGLWALENRCTLQPRPRRPKPADDAPVQEAGQS